MQDNSIDLAKAALRASRLSENEQMVIVGALEKGTEEFRQIFVEHFSAFPEELPDFYEDVLRKSNRFFDESHIDTLIDEEKQKMASLL